MTLELIQSNGQVQSPTAHDLLFLSRFKMLESEWFWKEHSLFPTGPPFMPSHFTDLNYKPDLQSTCICHPSLINLTPSIQNQGKTQKVKWYIKVPKVCCWVCSDLLDLGSMMHWGLCIIHAM